MKGNVKADAELIEELQKGAFVKLALKKAWRGSKTLTEKKKIETWIKDVLIDSPMTNEDCAKTIHYAYPVNRAVPVKDSGNRYGNDGTARPDEISFVYMDVGCWVGTKDPKFAHAWGNDARGLMRDFGIVCGPLVALCTYRYAFSGPSCAEWEQKKASPDEPWKSVAALIKALSTPSSGHDAELGEVIVRDMVFASDANGTCPKPDSYLIQVIVGDMHIPVLERKTQTYGGAFPMDNDVGFVSSGGQRMGLNTGDRDSKAFDRVVTKPGYVPRLGRLEIGGMEALVSALVGPGEKDGTKGLDKVVAFANDVAEYPVSSGLTGAGVIAGPLALGLVLAPEVAIPAFIAAYVAGKHLAKKTAEFYASCDQAAAKAGVPDDLMSIGDAEKWYKYYRDRDSFKAADIFEEAGEHLLHFVQRLASYPAIAKKQNLLPAQFFQLGDMVDFWVGFTCHYGLARK